jgi:RimK family alpha-L-glutamate ligase
MSMKRVLFIRNAFLDSAPFKFIEQQFVKEANLLGIDVVVKKNADYIIPSSFKNQPKVCVFWDKDVNLAVGLVNSGVHVMNSPEAIMLCDDKTKTFLMLNDKVPQPDTLICPKSFATVGYSKIDFLYEAIEFLGLPFVLKEGFGSYGEQVYLINNAEEAEELVKNNADKPLLFQRFIKESAGRDLRVYVVGGKVVAAMERQNMFGDFRSNHKGESKSLNYDITSEQEKIAIKACDVLGVDFAGVDILFSSQGPLVCEVNSNAHFGRLIETTGKNPAKKIAELVLARL